jgi:fatty-acyl-CoA synthase
MRNELSLDSRGSGPHAQIENQEFLSAYGGAYRPASLRIGVSAVNVPFARTLPGLLREQSQRTPGATAVISGVKAVSFAELSARAGRLAASLLARGVRRGDRIGLLMSNRIEWLEICFGASMVGAVVVPLSTWSTRSELEFLLADSRITLLFALSAFGDRNYAADLAQLVPELRASKVSLRFPALSGIVLIDHMASDGFTPYAQFVAVDAIKELPPGTAASAADDAMVLYTSGSSAHPKAVRLSHYAIIENGYNIGERQGLRPSDRVLLSPPLFWSYGCANALPAAFTHGAALVLLEKFESAAALQAIEANSCTALYTLPGMTSAMIRHPDFVPARVKSLRAGLTIGSEQDVRDAATSLGASEICNIYGATETYGNCCVTWHHWPLERRAACQGPPLPGNTLRFIDPETGAEVAPGAPGLVEIKGYVTPGYTNASADQNATAFTADGYYRTGDIGRLDETGAFKFVGRSTEMIKRAGINVSPAEVEEILRQHPAVALAGVTGVPDSDRGEMVVAFVVPKASMTVTGTELLAHCRLFASKYKIPDRIEIRSSLPQTPTGKLLRRELKSAAMALVANTGGDPHD